MAHDERTCKKESMSFTKEDQLKTKRYRKKKCKTCRLWFEPENEDQVICMTPECSIPFAKEKIAKEKRKAARESRQNTISKLKKRTETACNNYIRKRDEGQPCISCGYIWIAPSIGRKQNAGHFEGVGKRADLRYNEDNIHLQCEQCNTSLHGNPGPYRISLIKKIGLEKVVQLESNNTPRSYREDELRSIEQHYIQKLKDLHEKV